MDEIYVPDDTIEFMITDDRGLPVSPDGFNLSTANSFYTIFDATLSLIGNIPGGETTSFSLAKTTLMLAGRCDDAVLDIIESDLQELTETQTIEGERLAAYQTLHKLVKANGHNYAFNIKRKDKPAQTFASELKNVTKISAKKIFVEEIQVQPKVVLKFLRGYFDNIGGKYPNFHVKEADGTKYTIHFEKEDTQRIIKYLYQNVLVSFFVPLNGTRGRFCDVYPNEDEYIYHRDLHTKYEVMPKVDRGVDLHHLLIKLLAEEEYTVVTRILRTYLDDSASLALMKVALMATASNRDQALIKQVWKDLNTLSTEKQFLF